MHTVMVCVYMGVYKYAGLMETEHHDLSYGTIVLYGKDHNLCPKMSDPNVII